MKKSNLTALGTTGKKPLDKSLEEQAYEMEIHPIEAERLRKTFLRMCGTSTSNSQEKYKN